MGDTADIGSYQFQLEQVQEALSKDPKNESLLQLESDLKELISTLELVQQQQQPTTTTTSSSQPKPKKQATDKEPSELNALPSFVKGERVLAKYGDGKYYEATIDSISDKQPIQYHITYTQYNTSVTVPPTHLKPYQASTQPKKKKAVDSDRVAMFQEKRKRVKMEEKVHEGKQKAWQDFAKKRNITKNKKGLYDRPEMPDAQQVTSSSGKVMTTFKQRGKHKFEKEES